MILLITPKLREAVSFFEEISLNNFLVHMFTEYTLIWPPKTWCNHLSKSKTSALRWNISRYWSWKCVINYWIQLTLKKRKLFSRDIQIFHLWNLREFLNVEPLFRSNTTIITIYTLNIYLSFPCGLAEKWPFWPKIHARAQCLSWVDPSMVRYVYFLRFHKYPRYCISPIFPVQNPLKEHF